MSNTFTTKHFSTVIEKAIKNGHKVLKKRLRWALN